MPPKRKSRDLSEVLSDIKFSDSWKSIDECISEIESNSKFMREIVPFSFVKNTAKLMESLNSYIPYIKRARDRNENQELKKDLEDYLKKLKSIRDYLSEEELKNSSETDGDKMFNMIIEVLRPYNRYSPDSSRYLFADEEKIKSFVDKANKRFESAKKYFDKAITLWGEDNDKTKLFKDFGNELEKIACEKDEVKLVEYIKNCGTQIQDMSNIDKKSAFRKSLVTLGEIFKGLFAFVDALSKQRTITQASMKYIKALGENLEKITFVENGIEVEGNIEGNIKNALIRTKAYNKIDKKAANILKNLKNKLKPSVWDEINIRGEIDKLINYLDKISVTCEEPDYIICDPIPIPIQSPMDKSHLHRYFCEVIEKWNNKRNSVVYNHFKGKK